MMVEAVQEAINDAGIEKEQIQAAWQSNQFTEISVGHSGLPLAAALKLNYIPVTHVENLCASGTEALRAASYAVASGACDIALAVGFEKVKDLGFGGLPRANEDIVSMGTRARVIMPSWNNPNPGMFAMMAIRYFNRYGLSIEEGKREIAKISVKSHHNGTLAPKSHLKREITIDEVINAPMISFPLGLFDSCGVSDGAAAAIVTRADIAKKFRPDPVYVKAIQIAMESSASLLYQDYDYTHVETTGRAAVRAYKEAGISNPREQINLMEVHDCFSITEFVTYEDLLISPRGKAREDVDNGFFELGGKIPCQTDGGLKCFGHPIGASGLRMVYEIYQQLQGKADKRQLPNPHIGLTHNLGGQPPSNVCAISILGSSLG
jgi:acetyl-CoA C-acetyltransferase